MRAVLVSLCGFLIGMTTVVAVRHIGQWRRDKTRLMPLHVWMIALSYDLLLISLLSRDEPLNWRAVIYGPAIVLGVAGMVTMLRYQGHRRARREG